MANGNTTAKIGFEVLMYDGEPFDEKMTRLTSELFGGVPAFPRIGSGDQEKTGTIGYEVRDK